MNTFYRTALVAVALVAASTANAEPHAWSVGGNEYHLTGLDTSTVEGRAEMLTLLERSATRLCGNGLLVVERKACVSEIVTRTSAGPAGPRLQIAIAERLKRETLAVASTR